MLVSKQDVISNPKLMKPFLLQTAESTNQSTNKMSAYAKREFKDTWSEAKINYLVENEFKNKNKIRSKKMKKLTLKQWMKKNAKILTIGMKNDWIKFSEGLVYPVDEIENYVDDHSKEK